MMWREWLIRRLEAILEEIDVAGPISLKHKIELEIEREIQRLRRGD